CFARQVEAPDRGILVEIAQDVGELQRAPQMMGKQPAVFAAHAEYANRQAPDRARDAVAVEIERGEAWRPDILARIHLHAVGDGEEILLRQTEVADRLREACH